MNVGTDRDIFLVSQVLTEANGMSQEHRHSIWQSVTLHLVPGALITAFYFIAAPPVMRAGYPSVLALLLAVLVVLVPFELGYLLYEARRTTGTFLLRAVIKYREALPTWQYFLYVPLLVLWSFAVFGLLTPVDTLLIQGVFSWLPAWTFPSHLLDSLPQYQPDVLLITFGAGLALNGIAGPLVEELYFRGFLLPRIPASTTWAPLVNVVLFSLYHFFSPWQNLTRIVALIPLVYVVAWKRNIYLSILVHTTLNSLGMLAALASRGV